jgi:hypothetical protein
MRLRRLCWAGAILLCSAATVNADNLDVELYFDDEAQGLSDPVRNWTELDHCLGGDFYFEGNGRGRTDHWQHEMPAITWTDLSVGVRTGPLPAGFIAGASASTEPSPIDHRDAPGAWVFGLETGYSRLDKLGLAFEAGYDLGLFDDVPEQLNDGWVEEVGPSKSSRCRLRLAK